MKKIRIQKRSFLTSSIYNIQNLQSFYKHAMLHLCMFPTFFHGKNAACSPRFCLPLRVRDQRKKVTRSRQCPSAQTGHGKPPPEYPTAAKRRYGRRFSFISLLCVRFAALERGTKAAHALPQSPVGNGSERLRKMIRERRPRRHGHADERIALQDSPQKPRALDLIFALRAFRQFFCLLHLPLCHPQYRVEQDPAEERCPQVGKT